MRYNCDIDIRIFIKGLKILIGVHAVTDSSTADNRKASGVNLNCLRKHALPLQKKRTIPSKRVWHSIEEVFFDKPAYAITRQRFNQRFACHVLSENHDSRTNGEPGSATQASSRWLPQLRILGPGKPQPFPSALCVELPSVGAQSKNEQGPEARAVTVRHVSGPYQP